MRCLVVLLVAAVAVARAAEEPFYLRHMEFRRLVVAVEAGQPATAGNALVAHYAEEPATDALMFTQDPQTQSIITVDGGLCITDDNGLKLTECRPGESYYQLRYALGGRLAKGIVRGSDDASRTIASWSNKFAIMHRRDDPLIGLPYAANRHKFATKFVPKY